MIPSAEARKNLMKLSQRMVRSFCLNISNSYGQSLSGSTKDTVRITSRKVSDGLVLCAVSTTFLPYSHLQVFDLLRDNHRLSQVKTNDSSSSSSVSFDFKILKSRNFFLLEAGGFVQWKLTSRTCSYR